jgi:predicted Zn-dependent protease
MRVVASRLLESMRGAERIAAVDANAIESTFIARSEIQGGSDWTWSAAGFAERLGRHPVTAYAQAAFDPKALDAFVANVEAIVSALPAGASSSEPARDSAPRAAAVVNPSLWNEKSLPLIEPESRYDVLRATLAALDKSNLVGAGHLTIDANATGVLTDAAHYEYGRRATCEFSLTARTKDGTGSGWAAWVGNDWSRADPAIAVAHAIDLAERSRNPVAIEPQRYTVIMAPEALGELVAPITKVLDGPTADQGMTPFSKPRGGSKIGLPVFDERVTLGADPMDGVGGFLPFDFLGGMLVQFEATTWVERGVLRNLSFGTRDAEQHGVVSYANSGALQMAGGETPIEEMIATTDRGIYITRFSNVQVLSRRTLLMTGVTRDGTFLIERGKITKPIKNMRFEDSPFFFLNNLEALGPAKRVALGGIYVMPSAKVRDFTFTSLTDSI